MFKKGGSSPIWLNMNLVEHKDNKTQKEKKGRHSYECKLHASDKHRTSPTREDFLTPFNHHKKRPAGENMHSLWLRKKADHDVILAQAKIQR